MKQVHSNRGYPQPQSQLTEGDAHWITGTQVGLSVYTADCVPLLFLHPQLNKVAAFHCGWRGVAQRLIEKNLPLFEPDPDLRSQLMGFVGAHIRWESFEVDKDVGLQILEALPDARIKMRFVRERGPKWLVDLRGILREQVQSQGLRIAGEVHHDTFLSTRYYSARRQSKERQWSLVLTASTPEEIETLVPRLMS